jgi:hypothetical protein
MQRFFFHQRIGDWFIEDVEGFEHASAAAAEASAVVSARHLWAAAIIAGKDLSGESIEIVDASGSLVATVPLIAALPPRLASVAEPPRSA